jgi:plasmid stabilization system protein ParE
VAARRRVAWSERARDSLDEVLTYVAKDSPEGARSIARSAIELAASLATLAERGRVVPEFGDPSIREVFAFRYRLMYRVEAEQVTVLAFVHGARNFERWRREVEE